MEIVIGIILLIAAVFLIVSVLMQNGKAHNVGAITGGAETFFGKTKGSTIDRILSKVTSAVAIVFCVLVVLLYVFQDDTDFGSILDTVTPGTTVETVDGTDEAEVTSNVEETEEAGETTPAA